MRWYVPAVASSIPVVARRTRIAVCCVVALLVAAVTSCSCAMEYDPENIAQGFVERGTPVFRATVVRIEYTSTDYNTAAVATTTKTLLNAGECYVRHKAVLRVESSVLGPYVAGDEVTFPCTNRSCGDCSRPCPAVGGGEPFFETLGRIICQPPVTRDVLHHLANHTGRTVADLEGRCGPEHISPAHPAYPCLCGDPAECAAPQCARLDNGYCVSACGDADATTCDERTPFCEWRAGAGVCERTSCRRPAPAAGRNASACKALALRPRELPWLRPWS